MTHIVDGLVDGKPYRSEVKVMFDGRDYPVSGARRPNSTTSYKRIDSRTFEITHKSDGKTWMTTTTVVSADGKTLTATHTGVNEGQGFTNVLVYDKR
jgi:hypothetical protein